MNIDDLLTECVKVFLYSVARNRGEKKEYEGDLCCSGDVERKECRHKKPPVRRKREMAGHGRTS